MTEITYAFKGQRIEDEDGRLLAIASRDLSGKGVRWEPSDFMDSKTIDFKDRLQAARLTAALWRLHSKNKVSQVNDDWVI